MEEQAPRKCCICIPRNFGVRIIFFWILLGAILITNQTLGWGSVDENAYYWMAPILCTIYANAFTMGKVFFLMETPEGRTRVFHLWTYGVFIFWNAYWYFLVLNGVFVNPAEWECGAKFPNVASNDFKNCLEP